MSILSNNPAYLTPGTVVGVWVVPLHVGIVSDRRDFNGYPYIISDSARVGHGAEEPWEVFSGGRAVYQIDTLKSALPSSVVVTRARSMCHRKWNLLTWNCEHFVREALGIRVESPQLQFAVLACLGTLFLGLLFSKTSPR